MFESENADGLFDFLVIWSYVCYCVRMCVCVLNQTPNAYQQKTNEFYCFDAFNNILLLSQFAARMFVGVNRKNLPRSITIDHWNSYTRRVMDNLSIFALKCSKFHLKFWFHLRFVAIYCIDLLFNAKVISYNELFHNSLQFTFISTADKFYSICLFCFTSVANNLKQKKRHCTHRHYVWKYFFRFFVVFKWFTIKTKKKCIYNRLWM